MGLQANRFRRKEIVVLSTFPLSNDGDYGYYVITSNL